MREQWQSCIWQRAQHNAFTDLCEFNGMLVCSFREATNHISPDGVIRLLYLDLQGKLIRHQQVNMPGADLRDPKLSLTPDGKLLLLAYAKVYNGQPEPMYRQAYSWQTQDGKSWSTAKPLGDKNWWLWRIRWHQDKAYGVGYNREAQNTRLYAGFPRRTFQCIEPHLFSQRKQRKGYPNESDMYFSDDGTAHVLLRRDADSCTAQFGVSKPPYRRWTWHDLGFYLGGPTMLKLSKNYVILAGRIWQQPGPKTALVLLEIATMKPSLLHVFPSGGDTSYPGLVKRGKDLYVSYYSSHQQNKTCIYLTKLTLDDLLLS
ncbi:hypothetical protein [Bowmanella yangjiangensis]|uniref:Signal peptide prediction n=1 Tax=Bowmanella yangjiangensis TaxID=2811230 RepID=A0ABS3CRB9_9ALTE|nr:hypothetical protein [Bowmanella yangjiangensis]MBN7818845.1 hypothetical protein [Bowmanella yangjiangensis]